MAGPPREVTLFLEEIPAEDGDLSNVTVIDQGAQLPGAAAGATHAVPDTPPPPPDTTLLRWEQLPEPPESLCARGAASLTVVGDEVVVFGGSSPEASHNDVHIFNLAAGVWTAVPAAGDAPAPRGGHSAVAWDGAVFVFGGGDEHRERHYNDVFRFDVATRAWSRVDTTGSAPSRRTNHTAVARADGRMVVFGGASASGPADDVHELSLATGEWQRRACSGAAPEARDMHSAALVGDAAMVVAGGRHQGGIHTSAARLDLDGWEWSALPPCLGRVMMSAGVLASPAACWVTVGGWDGASPFSSDVTLLDAETLAVKEALVGGEEPEGRFGAAAGAHGDALYLFGGGTPEGGFADLWKLSVVSASEEDARGHAEGSGGSGGGGGEGGEAGAGEGEAGAGDEQKEE